MKTLIAFLLIWIGSETNYNVDLPHPEIKMLSQVELERVYYGDHENSSGAQLHAFYDPKNNLIYLNEDFDIHDAFDKGVLLHELLHYVQDMNDVVGTKFECMRETELEVYPLQKKYLLEVHGVKFEYDELFVKLSATCNPNLY
tara:strand:- start:57 stop:485 length:429 start_codon:yes stop_codon:yes gene_type:complete